MSSKGRLGRKGEELACKYLQENGHTILEKNYRSGHLEIDIISFDTKGIHFVEVKTRINPIVEPQESVNKLKQKRLAKAAQQYLRKSKNPLLFGAECFFDIIAIAFSGNEMELKYFPEAFIPMYY